MRKTQKTMTDTEAVNEIYDILFPPENPDEQWTTDEIEYVANIIALVRTVPRPGKRRR